MSRAQLVRFVYLRLNARLLDEKVFAGRLVERDLKAQIAVLVVHPFRVEFAAAARTYSVVEIDQLAGGHDGLCEADALSPQLAREFGHLLNTDRFPFPPSIEIGNPAIKLPYLPPRLRDCWKVLSLTR